MSNERDAYRILQITPDAHEVVVTAAFRALAALHHPDRDSSPLATRRMAELNDAYAKVRTRDRREGYDRLREGNQGNWHPPVVVAGTSARPSGANGDSGTKPAADTLDFGRYAGWSIQQLAKHDPDYLVWLSRHSSGIRYRRSIEESMAPIRAARQRAAGTGTKRR